MIITEMLPDGKIHTYSDADCYIRQDGTGYIYEDAIDIIPHTYTETSVPIDHGDIPNEEQIRALIEEIIRQESPKMVARSNIESGKYFLVGDTLYFSTTSIANGEDLVLGVNCVKANLANTLNEL